MSNNVVIRDCITPYKPFLERVSLDTRAKWGAALREKGLRQAKRSLKKYPARGGTPGYCCLGILQERVFGYDISMRLRCDNKQMVSTSSLAYGAAQAELGSSNPTIAENHCRKGHSLSRRFCTASYCNDILDLSFKEIADLVHPEGAKP